MKLNKKTGHLTFTGGEEFKTKWTDPDGYVHNCEMKAGKFYHRSKRPYCSPCGRYMDIYQDEHIYTEICPICGQGSGNAWS